MIGILELLGLMAAIAAGSVLASMLFVLLCLFGTRCLMDALTWVREGRVEMEAKKRALAREAVQQRSKEEQLTTLRAENAALTYENQTLVQRLNAAGIVALPSGSARQLPTAKAVGLSLAVPPEVESETLGTEAPVRPD